jgi:hypothetical protein
MENVKPQIVVRVYGLDNAAINDADVKIQNEGESYHSTEFQFSHYCFGGIPEGSHTVVVQRNGYQQQDQTVQVGADTEFLDFNLVPVGTKTIVTGAREQSYIPQEGLIGVFAKPRSLSDLSDLSDLLNEPLLKNEDQMKLLGGAAVSINSVSVGTTSGGGFFQGDIDTAITNTLEITAAGFQNYSRTYNNFMPVVCNDIQFRIVPIIVLSV